MAGSDTGPDVANTQGSEVPDPVLNLLSYEWRRQRWPATSTVWPNPQPPAVAHSKRARTAILTFCGLNAVLAALTIVSSVMQATAAASTFWSMVILAIPVLAVLLRYRGTAPRFATFLFVSVNVIGWFLIVAAFAAAAATGASSAAPWLSLAILGTYLVLFAFAWRSMRATSVTVRRDRRLAEEAVSTVPAAVYQRRVHGDPGAGLVNATRFFGEGSVALGRLGEQITASILDELLVIPGVQIVHGLKFPGAASADIDHAVVAGNRVALIDSKLWMPGHYEMDRYNRVLRNRSMSARRHSNQQAAVERMSQTLRGAEVRGWIVIHPSSAGAFSVAPTGQGSLVNLVSADQLLREVGDWLAPGGEVTNLLLVRDVLAWRNW